MATPKVLLTSICKPIGPCVGDGESVGYELLHGQVTRAQDIYSPRVTHRQFSLDYIAENLDGPSTVLHYPSIRRFEAELRRGYDVVGIAFVLSTFHHAVEMCKTARRVAPQTKIVLGGYGTILSDEELAPLCDAICREEGVAFMRRYLGQPPLGLRAYRHPDIRSRLRVFGIPVAHTAMTFAGLGCPNGCDFCCTSHFFKRKHIALLDSGRAVFEQMSEQKRKWPELEHCIIDEDFLLHKARADQFLAQCRASDISLSTFCFASVKALSRFSFEEILEMGIDGLWVGYEGKQSGYIKQRGADIDQLIRDLQDHGITVLTSMIVGIPYQTDEIARKEFADLMSDRPTLTQFLIYGPTPGTPFYDKVMQDDLLHEDLIRDRRAYYKKCSGFDAMVKHPFLRREEIEAMQREFYDREFMMLGPSIFRVAQVKLNGWRRYKDHPKPQLRRKAAEFRDKVCMFLAVLPVGMVGPKISWRNRWKYFKQWWEIFSIASWRQRLWALAAPIMMLGALLSWITLRLGLFQHPITRAVRYPGRIASEITSEIASEEQAPPECVPIQPSRSL